MLVVKKFDFKHDIKFLYSLRKNIQVRNFFFNNNIINYSNHLLWIRKSEKNNLIYIVYYYKKKIGYIRYSFNQNFYSISVANLPYFRKKRFNEKSSSQNRKIFKEKKLFLQRLKPTISYQLNFLSHADLKFFEIIMKD